MRSLFWKIFLWFLAAQLLIGAAFFLLALATQRNFDERLRAEVGDNLEARARAAAIIYEYGGAPALREVWRLRGNNRRRERANETPQSEEKHAVRREEKRALRRDGSARRSPEIRTAAALYQSGARMPLIGAPLPPAANAILAEAAREGDATTNISGGGAWLARRFVTPSGKSYIAVSRTRPPPDAFAPLDWRGDWRNALAKIFIVALTLGAFCFLLARSLTRPILMLQRATRQLAAGKLTTRIGAQMGNRRDELAALGGDFDVMAQRIESLMTAQNRLLADISHELRSPLTRLQLTLDLAESDAEAAAIDAESRAIFTAKKTDAKTESSAAIDEQTSADVTRESAKTARQSNEKARDYLARMRREAERLNALIAQLLTLTRLEGDAAQARREPLDLAALVAEVAADADFEARGKNRRVRVTADEHCVLRGDAELLRRAIENVVRNAIHHAPENSEIEIALHRESAGENEAASTRNRAASLRHRAKNTARELPASVAPIATAHNATAPIATAHNATAPIATAHNAAAHNAAAHNENQQNIGDLEPTSGALERDAHDARIIEANAPAPLSHDEKTRAANAFGDRLRDDKSCDDSAQKSATRAAETREKNAFANAARAENLRAEATIPQGKSAAPESSPAKSRASTRGEKARDQNTQGFAVLSVRDFGGGVPGESLAHLFDPFYRVATARDRNSGGVGLGLSIAARAVRLHGGSVAAHNAEGGGLLVEIRIPLTTQNDARAAL